MKRAFLPAALACAAGSPASVRAPAWSGGTDAAATRGDTVRPSFVQERRPRRG